MGFLVSAERGILLASECVAVIYILLCTTSSFVWPNRWLFSASTLSTDSEPKLAITVNKAATGLHQEAVRHRKLKGNTRMSSLFCQIRLNPFKSSCYNELYILSANCICVFNYSHNSYVQYDFEWCSLRTRSAVRTESLNIDQANLWSLKC